MPSKRVPRTVPPSSPAVTQAYTLTTSFWLAVPVTPTVKLTVSVVAKFTLASNISEIKAMQKALVGLVDDDSVTAACWTIAPACAPS